jgi:SulP family sulfate permease
MRNVPYIDATGLRTLKEVLHEMQQSGTKVILSGVSNEKVIEELNKSRIMFMVGKANVKPAFPEALDRAKEVLFEEEEMKSRNKSK